MRIGLETFTVSKQFPLRISRGTTAQSTNIWVRLEQQGVEGWGEASPFSISPENSQTTEIILAALEKVIPELEPITPWERQKVEEVLLEADIPSAARAAIDLALYDWLGKKLGMPLWRIWGLNRKQVVPTSVTIGIDSPAGAKERAKNWQKVTGAVAIKVKLGSSEGTDADQKMFMAVREEAPNAQLSVDANGAWNVNDAVKMCSWLARQGVNYVEQPLAAGQEEFLPVLYKRTALPILADESCFTSKDIPNLVGKVHGVNIKLMKSGGLTEAMRTVHIARAFGLKVMLGCYSDSSLANAAASQLSPLADYLDLDSHLNLVDDPFMGAALQNGYLRPSYLPGLGVQRRASKQ